MRHITTKDFKPLDAAQLRGVGPAPQLDWLPVARLVLDDSYQRPIRQQGVRHLRQIAERFDWRLFAPVIVAPVEGGGYAVIDGQHRAHAAMLRGLEKLPCCIVQADRKMQARAFATMNGQQAIRLAPYQIHRAAVASGDPQALIVDEACVKAGVTITTNKPSNLMERGDTVAVATIYKAIAQFGVPTTVAALKSIVMVGDGHVGLVNHQAITAYAELYDRRKDLRDQPDLLDWLDDFDLPTAMEQARIAAPKRAEQRAILISAIEDFLSAHVARSAVAQNEVA
jgi:hypothetical protein